MSEEIAKMEPGRDMDALVAEVIFGYRVYRYADRDWQAYSPGLHKAACRMQKYSQTLSAAGRVVDKFGAWDIKKRYSLHPDDPPGSPGRATYQAEVMFSGRESWSPWCWSFPEAICKAALQAKLEGGESAAGEG